MVILILQEISRNLIFRHKNNLQTLGFTTADMNVIGKFDMNFKGDNIDNFFGTVSLYDGCNKKQSNFVFDTHTKFP